MSGDERLSGVHARRPAGRRRRALDQRPPGSATPVAGHPDVAAAGLRPMSGSHSAVGCGRGTYWPSTQTQFAPLQPMAGLQVIVGALRRGGMTSSCGGGRWARPRSSRSERIPDVAEPQSRGQPRWGRQAKLSIDVA